MKPTVYFATDHAGFVLKNSLLTFVRDELGYEVVDCGAHTFDEHDDYPDFIHQAARAVEEDPYARRAFIFGHSGQGEAMVANRYTHVRAAVYYGSAPEIVTLSREHNNANILSLGAHFLTEEDAKNVARTWLATNFSEEERHQRRIQKIEQR